MNESPDDSTNLEKRRRRETQSFGEETRALPADMNAEQSLLCAALLDPPTVLGIGVERGITPEVFNMPAHAGIWRLMTWMNDQGVPIDLSTLVSTADKRGLLEEFGGAVYLWKISDHNRAGASNASYFADILIEKHTLRGVIRAGNEFSSRAYSEQHDPPGLLDEFSRRISSIARNRGKQEVDINEVMNRVEAAFQRALDAPGVISGLSTGFPAIDTMIDGIKPGELIVLGALRSHGKTAFAMSMAEFLMIDLWLPVGIFSVEMSAQQLMMRAACSRARVNWFSWRDGFATPNEIQSVSRACGEWRQAAPLIDETSAISIEELKAKARRWRDERGIRAIFVDYLQLCTSRVRRGGRGENRTTEVAEVSTGLKALAKDLGIPVIALAQISREVEKQGRRPMLSDLRECGGIENDADVVGLLTCEELLHPEDPAWKGKATVNFAKQRNGPLGDVPLTFLREFTRFQSRAEKPEPDPQTELMPTETSPKRRRNRNGAAE